MSSRPNTAPSATAISQEVIDAARGARVIVAPTTSASDAWAWPRQPAVALAKAIDARLILADVSTRSIWTTPYGTGGVGADRAAPYSDGTTAVSQDELQLLGHDEILRQVREAEAAGVETNAWLADRPGIRGLDRLLSLVQFDVLVAPPLDSPSLRERLAGDDIGSVRRRMVGRLLLIAHEDGSLTVDESSRDERGG